MSRLFRRKTDEKKKRKSPLTITNPSSFVHQVHIDSRGDDHDHGNNVTIYRKALRPAISFRGKPNRDSFYISIPNVAEEFKLDIINTFNSTMLSNENDLRKARSVNCLDESTAQIGADKSYFGHQRTWSHSADNLDSSVYHDDDPMTDMDNNVFDGPPVHNEVHGEEEGCPPTPPLRGASMDQSECQRKRNSDLTDISSMPKSQSANILEHSVSISSGSSGIEHGRHLSKSSEHFDGDFPETESQTPPPPFRPPPVIVTDVIGNRPKSHTVPRARSPTSDDDRQAKLTALLAKFSAKPKRIPLSNDSSLCNSIESLDDVSEKPKVRLNMASKFLMKSTENLDVSIDLAAEVPAPHGYLSAPESNYISPRPTAPKVTPRTRPSQPDQTDFKLPPVPKPRRQRAIDLEDDDDCITDL